MIYRRFVLFTAWSVLFCGNFTLADVIQAYRTPSEADLQWLLGDAPTLIPSVASPSVIVQAGHMTKKTGALIPTNDPCRPAHLPRSLPAPPIPPAPIAATNSMNTGLVAEEEGVVNITSTVFDSATPVVQMSDRLPPPAEIPREQETNLTPLLGEPTIERLPAERPPVSVSRERPLPPPCYSLFETGCNNGLNNVYGTGVYCTDESSGLCNDADWDDSFCICFTCILSGNYHQKGKYGDNSCAAPEEEEWIRPINKIQKKYAIVFSVPDMVGSSAWFTDQYVTINSKSFALPTMLLSRPNVVEHFNADVQNRIWADYRHWNNAVTFDGESRGVDQFSFGLEKKILKRSSVELRIPVIYQFGSGAIADSETAVELGNVSVFSKHVLIQRPRWTISGGMGTSLPTAKDWRPGGDVRLKNKAYSLSSFLGAQWHPNSSTFGHFVVQADVPIEKNVLFDNGDPIKIKGQQVIRTGVQLGRWIYRTDHGKRPCRFGVFAEVNYAVVTEGSPEYPAGGTTISAFNAQKSTLTAAAGMPMVFGKLTCTNALILPISGSDRPFSAAYNFSLTRQF
jgi:hypothetical protein